MFAVFVYIIKLDDS